MCFCIFPLSLFLNPLRVFNKVVDKTQLGDIPQLCDKILYTFGAWLCMVLKLGRFRAADQKYLESFEMWCWRRMEKIGWTDHVRNEEVLLRINEQRNILHEIRKRKAKWIGHILRRNCLIKQVIEG